MNRSIAALDGVIAEVASLPDSKKRGLHTQPQPQAEKKSATAPPTPVVPSVTHFLSSPSLEKINLDHGLISGLTELFNVSLKRAYPKAVELGFDTVNITRSTGVQAADLQCNSAMNLFALLKKSGDNSVKKPQDVSTALIENLPANSFIEKAVVSGPGFINIHLSGAAITNMVVNVARTGPSAPSISGKRVKVLVDFSSPNIAKEMHVGHLRSTIIGDTLCRVLEFSGFEVLRVNHIGDWGTQFGMLIQYLKEQYPNWRASPPDLSELSTFYKAAKARFDEDEDFKSKARLNVPLLQSGDKECREIWTLLCDISRAEFVKVYKRLGVELQEFGESFYNSAIPAVLKELEDQKRTYQEEGALMMSRDSWQCPLILRKADGGYGYDSTDMAAINYRVKQVKADWIIYVTDVGQRTHFDMIFDAARDAGWIGDIQLDHVGFGVVCGADGKRIKSRCGASTRLVDLLDEAVTRMEATLLERKKEGKTDLSEEDIKVAAAQIGYGAVKYMDLRNNPNTNYTFSFERMLDTRGDTAVYLLFAYARLVSIIRKGAEKGANIDEIKARGALKIEHACERALAFQILQFPDVVLATLQALQPNRLCEYIYALSDKFTAFITELQVLGSPEQESRLLLCEATDRKSVV